MTRVNPAMQSDEKRIDGTRADEVRGEGGTTRRRLSWVAAALCALLACAAVAIAEQESTSEPPESDTQDDSPPNGASDVTHGSDEQAPASAEAASTKKETRVQTATFAVG